MLELARWAAHERIALTPRGCGMSRSGAAVPLRRNPVCLSSRDDVDTGLARMRTHRVRRMPVLNEQAELVGIVSLDDMLMHMGHTLSTAADLVEEEVAAVPGDAWPRCGR